MSLPSNFAGTAVAALLAFVLGAAITPLVRALARRCGAVAAPQLDRWHKKPTAMLGGMAIFLATTLTVAFVLHPGPSAWIIIATSAFLFGVGLVDDILHIKPYQKLVGQVMGAAVILYFGIALPWTPSPLANAAITIFWIVGITNAVNMLDNMDGLAAGVAAIGATFLALNFSKNGQFGEAAMLAVLAASLLAFLLYNSNPASIFMGDCGSMFVGFFLASTALLSAVGADGRTRSIVPVLAVPVLVLIVPIFDTTFVTLLRKLSGRAASQGGRDHTSHRLVALGLSERRAVWMLYGFAVVAGLLSIAVRGLKLDVSIALIVVFVLGLTYLGIYLADVKVYSDEEIARAHKTLLVAFLFDLSYKRRIFEVSLDVFLTILAYYSAYAIVFGPYTQSANWWTFSVTLPIVVFATTATFLLTGVYRGIWRFISFENVVTYVKAVVLGTTASALVIFALFRLSGISRTVLVLHTAFLMTLVMASRVAFKLLRKLIPLQQRSNVRRVLIYGAGDAGELLWRELRSNPRLEYVPVGFIDDDGRKAGKSIHGLPVNAGDAIGELCLRQRVDEVVISTTKIPNTRIRQVFEACELAGVSLKRMTIRIAPVRLFGSMPPVADMPVSDQACDDSDDLVSVRAFGSTHVLERPAPVLRVRDGARSRYSGGATSDPAAPVLDTLGSTGALESSH